MGKVEYNQPGYAGWSRSTRAEEAEDRGLLPLTRAAKTTGIPAELIRTYVDPVEEHHTGKYASMTDYYDVDEIATIFASGDPAAALAQPRPRAKAQVYEHATAQWTEWHQPPRGKRVTWPPRQRQDMDVHDARITISGAAVTIEADGQTWRKRTNNQSLTIRTTDGWVLDNQRWTQTP